MGLSVCHCCSIRRHGTPVPHPREPIIRVHMSGTGFPCSAKLSAAKVKPFSDTTKHFHEKVNLKHENAQRYMADITGAFEVDGLVKQKEALESLLMSNTAIEKKVQGLIRKVLLTARREISNAAKSKIESDPRKAYKAVKTSVYKQILGGNVSLFDKKKKGAPQLYEPQRKLRPGQRGGNRVTRSMRTEQVMSYQGADRSFILRFLEGGTADRVAGSRGGHLSGRRGRITPRLFFGTSSHAAMQKAADQLSALIDEMIKKEFSKQ